MPVDRTAWVLLCLLVFTMPWEKSLIVPGLGSITRLVGTAAFLAGVPAAVGRRGIRLVNSFLIAATAFVAWEILTSLWSLDPSASTARAITFVQLLAMVWLIWDQCRDDARLRQLLHAYVAGGVVASAYTVLRYALNQQTYWRRYAAAGFDPNDLGLTVALSIPLALYLALPSRGVVAWFYRLAVALAIAAILLTASRTSLIAAFIAFGFAAGTWRLATPVQRISSAALLLLLVLGLVWFAPAASRERLATVHTELTQGTLHSRTRIWKAGLKALKQHPIAGVGAGAYADAVEPWIGVPGRPGHEYVAHNTFLSVLVETGLIGFGLFSLMLVLIALYVWVMPVADRALWVTMLVVWAAGMSTLTWEHRKPTWLLFSLVAAAWARAWWPLPVRESSSWVEGRL